MRPPARTTPLRDWLVVLRLGLVQASIGAVVVFATSTLNRVMVVELALPAIVPGSLVALHNAVQMLRPRWGHGSDRGGRRTPWIVGGMMILAGGSVLASLATALVDREPAAGIALAVVAYLLIGVGVGAAGTALLLLLTRLTTERRRPAAATIVWMMMIAGFIVAAGVAGQMLAPFSTGRLVEASATIAGMALLVTLLAIWGIERGHDTVAPATAAGAAFLPALREVWAEPAARRFTLFVFVSMLAYSAQELVIEPFAGSVFGLAPADSARLAGLQHSGLLTGMAMVAVLASAVGGQYLGSMRLWTMGGCAASGVAIAGLAAIGLSGADGVGYLRPAVVALGVANGAFSIAAVASMMQLAGSGTAGRDGVRMGLWGAAQAVAFATGGVVGTGTSDLARHLLGSPVLGYAAIFAGEAMLFGCAAALAAHVFPGASGEATAGPRPAPTALDLEPEASRWAI